MKKKKQNEFILIKNDLITFLHILIFTVYLGALLIDGWLYRKLFSCYVVDTEFIRKYRNI